MKKYDEKSRNHFSKYKRRIESKKQIPVGNHWSDEYNSFDYNNDILFSVAKSNKKFTSLADTFKFAIHRAESEVHESTNKRSDTKSRQINHIHQNQGLKNDSTRTTTKFGITKEREAKYRAYTKARKTRDGVYQQIVGDAENLRTKLEEYITDKQPVKQSIIARMYARIPFGHPAHWHLAS